MSTYILVKIYSDSMTFLQAISDEKSLSCMVKSIHGKIRLHGKIHLFWVKDHIGISPNEHVDNYAKEVTKMEKI